jgi:hypothetical protein
MPVVAEVWYVTAGRSLVTWGAVVVDGKAAVDILRLVNAGLTTERRYLWARAGQPVSVTQVARAVADASANPLPAPAASNDSRTVGARSVAVTKVPYAATVTPNVDTTDLLEVDDLTGPLLVANPVGTPRDGQTLTLRLAQDATGGRVMTFGTAYHFGSDVTAAMPTTADKGWQIAFAWNAGAARWWATSIARGFTDVDPAPPTPTSGAPLAAYTVGTQVGVPTGTTLTATTGLPAPDATETVTLVHPVTSQQIIVPGVKVWRRRRWTAVLSATVPAGEHWMFDECAFEPSTNSFFAVDIATPDGGVDPLNPTVILRKCTLDGGDRTTNSAGLHRTWATQCHVVRAENAWVGGAICTFDRCNLVAGIGFDLSDPHPDALQMLDTGKTTFWRCWLDGGPLTGAQTANSVLRVGTEGGADVDDVQVRECGFGGHCTQTVQFRGDSGSRSITNVQFVGNRWCDDGSGFEYDFQQAGSATQMISTWSDNVRGASGTVGGVSRPAGTVLTRPSGANV